MFEFSPYCYPGDSERVDLDDGGHATAELIHDEDSGPPWELSDGHGPVSDWTTRNKSPGELVLHEDRGRYRYYDFAEAVAIAKRDGWGYLPHKLVIECDEFGNGGRATAGPFTAYDPDNFNRAIESVYEQHRQTMTAKQYAAEAARRDYEYLRKWCNDDWHYVGVVVTVFDGAGDEVDSQSLWGIECGDIGGSDCCEYLSEVANELLEECGYVEAQ